MIRQTPKGWEARDGRHWRSVTQADAVAEIEQHDYRLMELDVGAGIYVWGTDVDAPQRLVSRAEGADHVDRSRRWMQRFPKKTAEYADEISAQIRSYTNAQRAGETDPLTPTPDQPRWTRSRGVKER